MTVSLPRRSPGNHRVAGHRHTSSPAPGMMTVGLLVLLPVAAAVGPLAALLLIEHHRGAGDTAFPQMVAAFAGTGVLLGAALVMVTLAWRRRPHPQRAAERFRGTK